MNDQWNKLNPVVRLTILATLVAVLVLPRVFASPAEPTIDGPSVQAVQVSEGDSGSIEVLDGQSEVSAGGAAPSASDEARPLTNQAISEDGTYTSPYDVADYLHLYGHLPSNYISKTKAKKAGWDSSAGNLWDVCPGMSIGGGPFYNDDGLLPEAEGREWKECDVNYDGGYRGPERLCYSNDGLIYYTDDHYKSFTQLY